MLHGANVPRLCRKTQARCDEEKPCSRCVRRKTQATCMPWPPGDDDAVVWPPQKQLEQARAGWPPALAEAGMFVWMGALPCRRVRSHVCVRAMRARALARERDKRVRSHVCARARAEIFPARTHSHTYTHGAFLCGARAS